jgi:hypothetical protein
MLLFEQEFYLSQVGQELVSLIVSDSNYTGKLKARKSQAKRKTTEHSHTDGTLPPHAFGATSRGTRSSRPMTMNSPLLPGCWDYSEVD